jgi:hypothetical protein
MDCPLRKENPGDCPRCCFVKRISVVKEYFRVDGMWICNYPYAGNTNLEQLRDEIKNLTLPG